MKKDKYLIVMFFLIQNIIHNMGHPVTPDFVRSLGIEDYMFGVFFAMMSLGLVIGGPIWGALGDRGKKKNFIVIGLILYSIGQFGFGYSGNQYIMVFFRLLSGFGVVASITLLTSHLVEMTNKNERARYLALIAAAVTLGASLGYYLGGFIAENSFTRELFNITNYKEIFLIQALLNIVYILVIVIFFHDKKTQTKTIKKISVFSGFKSIKNMDYRLLMFLIALTFISIGQINLNKYIDVYFIDLAYTPLQLSEFKLVTGGFTLIASIFLVPFFGRIRKQIGLMIVIQALSAVIVFYTFRANQFIIIVYSVYMLYIILKAIFTPLEQKYISLHAKEGEYGKIMGTRQSFISMGYVIGPLVGGVLYGIRPQLLFDSSAIAFLIGLIILVLLGFLYKKERNTNEDL
ncbi:MAG: MFS transporter [Sphaerochaetaceae bacterium]|nr:MFS transporter [Sphaerochaetaceae bacterium]